MARIRPLANVYTARENTGTLYSPARLCQPYAQRHRLGVVPVCLIRAGGPITGQKSFVLSKNSFYPCSSYPDLFILDLNAGQTNDLN